MLQYDRYTRDRIRQLVERLRAKVYRDTRPAVELRVSVPTGRTTREEAQALAYRPAALGEPFGPQWTTFWFRVRALVPPEWRGGRVDLLWNSHSEATLWVGGQPRQGLNYEPASGDRSVRPDALLLERAAGGETLEFEVEMACNKVFGYGQGYEVAPFRHVSEFVLDRCEVALFDPEAWDLYHDLLVLQTLEAESVTGSKDLDLTWAGTLLRELNRVANTFDPDDRATWPAARGIARTLYENRNATRVHELSAIGHAHIDTAWLWPLAETYRKCVRSFSSQLLYMERYPEFRFACSQAQQYAWMRDGQPALYARIKERVRGGQWVPVGGTWIEPDCNLPSGEALARQFLYGQRFFKAEFGRHCREFWNPDVFGYNGQLPQLMRGSGITRFLTQKLSWNRFNKPAHHTFTWQGLDGSEVLTHFPPADTYNALTPQGGKQEVTQLRDNARLYKDHVRSRESLLLFGFGDGGGGPTPRMLEILRRVADLQGVPRTAQRSADEFFARLEEDATALPTMVGELYFEYHRGTYTSQAAVKRGNRRSEWALHDAEFLSVAATRLHGAAYPRPELTQLWEMLLLNQFHDILPGSSIAEVYADAARDHGAILEGGGRLQRRAARRHAGLRRGPAVRSRTGRGGGGRGAGHPGTRPDRFGKRPPARRLGRGWVTRQPRRKNGRARSVVRTRQPLRPVRRPADGLRCVGHRSLLHGDPAGVPADGSLRGCSGGTAARGGALRACGRPGEPVDAERAPGSRGAATGVPHAGRLARGEQAAEGSVPAERPCHARHVRDAVWLRGTPHAPHQLL